MTNTFDNKDGEQNIGQGRNAIGKQLNNCISTEGNQASAIHAGGNVTVTYGMSPAEAAEYAATLVEPLHDLGVYE